MACLPWKRRLPARVTDRRPRPPPQSSPPPDRAAAAKRRADAIKAEVVEAAAAFKAMSDDFSSAEKLSVEANIAVIEN